MAGQRRAPRLAVVILLGVAAAYGLYILILHQKSERLVRDIRAAGEPVTPFELDEWYEAVPPEENAADIYSRAVANYTGFYGETENLPFVGRDDWHTGEPVSAELKEAIGAHLVHAKTTFDLLRKAAGMPRCRYPIDLTLGQNVELGHLAQLRQMARALSLKTLYHADNKEAGEAIQAIEDGLAVGHSLTKEPILISQLVRIACTGVAVASLEELLSRMDLTDQEYAELDQALAESYNAEGMRRGMVGERAMSATVFGNIGDVAAMVGTNKSWLRGSLGTVVNSLYHASGIGGVDKIAFLSGMSRMVDATRQPFPAALDGAEQVDHNIANTPTWRAPLTMIILPALTRALNADARDLAMQRMARTALAIERYRIAKGALPSALTDLVPQFLPELFQDPFDGQPLRYKQTPDGYMIYTIGDDRQDDGGEEKPKNSGKGAKGRDFAFHVVKNYIAEAEEQ